MREYPYNHRYLGVTHTAIMADSEATSVGNAETIDLVSSEDTEECYSIITDNMEVETDSNSTLCMQLFLV